MASRGVRVAGDLGRLGCEAVRYQCELEEQYEQHTERLEAMVSATAIQQYTATTPVFDLPPMAGQTATSHVHCGFSDDKF